jgi:hypothetical protein
MDFTNIIEPVKRILERVRDYNDIEIEGRLGVYDRENGVFETNIGDECYDKIDRLLKSCQKWESTDKILTTDYFYKDLRLTTTDKGNQYCIKKVKLASFTFQNETGEFDFRISISAEIPVRVDEFPKDKDSLKQREKNRIQCKYDGFNFDLTNVSMRESKDSNETINYFEYEVEYNEPLKDKDLGRIVYSIILKLLDAIFACDNYIKTDFNELPLSGMNIQCIKEKVFKESINSLKNK